MLGARQVPEMLLQKFGESICVKQERNGDPYQRRIIVAKGPENILLRVQDHLEPIHGISFIISDDPGEQKRMSMDGILEVRVSGEKCQGDDTMYQDSLSIRRERHSTRLGHCKKEDRITRFLCEVKLFVMGMLEVPGLKFSCYRVVKDRNNMGARVLVD